MFPRLGPEGGPASPASRASYFAVTPFARVLEVGNESVLHHNAEIHAKRMGSTQTVCGLGTTSWTKLWDFPFPGDLAPLCVRCLDVVRRERAGRSQHGGKSQAPGASMDDAGD